MPNPRYQKIEDVIAYLQTDNNTNMDNQPRYSYNMGILMRDALQFKWFQHFSFAYSIFIVIGFFILCTNSVTYSRFYKWAANDTYGELIEAIATDQIDFALAFYLIIPEREPYYSPLAQVSEFRWSHFFAFRRLDFLSNLIFRSRFYFLTTIDVDIFGDYLLQPFSKSVWISIGVATLCISIALQFISQHDQSLKISSFIATFGIYCQQGIFLFPMILKVKHRSSFFFRRLSYTKTYVRPLFIHTVAFIQHHNLQLLYIRFGVNISEVSIEKQNK